MKKSVNRGLLGSYVHTVLIVVLSSNPSIHVGLLTITPAPEALLLLVSMGTCTRGHLP